MTGILKRIENELVEKVLQAETGTVHDGPRTATSYLKQLPIREWGFEQCPGLPYWADAYGDPDFAHILDTLGKLKQRAADAMPTAYKGLSHKYTIDDQTYEAYEFLYGAPWPGSNPVGGPSAPNELTVDSADDFELPWTTYKGVYEDSQQFLKPFAKTLASASTAESSFWPTIASFGIPYNLLVLSKVDGQRVAELKSELGAVWTSEDMAGLQKKGLLYEIDMSILAELGPSTAFDNTVRFTPGTVTVLKQDAQSKKLTPIAITASTTDGLPPRVYTSKSNAWLWALQAAKTSVTVWGIWLGHVYHWHIVTAAMQMTMYNHLPAKHRLYDLMEPQSQSLIDFDFVLLSLLWGQISPPTPVPGYMSFLGLIDRFAATPTGPGRTAREFFDDDPLSELAARGIEETDFTVTDPWDAFPLVGFLLDIWGFTGDFVDSVVDVLYPTDNDVKSDKGLKAWMTAAADPEQGNVRGLPDIRTKAELKAVLTSILYRVTVHGAGSMTPIVNPTLSFIANFPPCLQRADIPEPGDSVTPTELLGYLPHTGTMGGMTTFYFTFAYSPPYVPLIPSGGIRTDPQFPQQPCNEALFTYRQAVHDFVDEYVKAWEKALAKILGRGPGTPPSYAQNQYGQWPSSIEI